MKKLTLNPWAIATLACLCFLFVAADSVGPNVPSVFSRIISTNKTADAWRGALSVPSAANLTTVSNAQVTTADNLVTVSNAQVTTGGKLSGYVTNLGGFATNAALVGGTVTGQTNLDLTASRVMVSGADGVPASSSVSTTTLGYLDAASSVQTQLDSKPTVALTNVARLDQSQTWTGTPTFPAAVFSANNIGMRLLWSSPTNIYIDTTAVSATPLTNNGDFALGTKLFIASIPPLLGSNSAIVFQYTFMRTNANAANPTVVFYVGPNTNYAGGAPGFIGTASSYLVATGPLALIQGASSHTNQIVLLNALGAVVGPQNLFDSTVTNNFYANVYATTAATNILLYGARLYEFYAP